MTTSHCVLGMVTVGSLAPCKVPLGLLRHPLVWPPIQKEECNQEMAARAFGAPVGLQSCSF